METPVMPTETPVPTPAPSAPKKNNTVIIIVVAVVVVLCCCCLIGLGAFGYSRYMAGKALTNFNQIATEMPSGMPTMPSTGGGSGGSGTGAGQIPTGGLGDEITRTAGWGYALSTIVQADPMSCQQPDAASTTIEVTKQPDSSGAWQERWTVACGGGKTIPVDLTFTPAGAGLFNVTAKLAK